MRPEISLVSTCSCTSDVALASSSGMVPVMLLSLSMRSCSAVNRPNNGGMVLEMELMERSSETSKVRLPKKSEMGHVSAFCHSSSFCSCGSAPSDGGSGLDSEFS